MTTRNQPTGTLLLAACLVACSGGEPSTGASKQIAEIYGSVERYTEPRLDVEVLSVERIELAAFADTDLLSAITMPGGRMMDLPRSSVTRNGRTVVTYTPRWTEDRPAWVVGDEGTERAGASLAEMLDAGRQSPEMAWVVEVTHAYSVTVRIRDQERARSYRSLFFYSDEQLLAFVDHVMPDVRRTWAETEPAPGDLDLSGVVGSIQQASSVECLPFAEEKERTHWKSDDTGHIWGKHYHDAAAKIECKCEGSISTCTSSITKLECDDDGFTDMCHVTAVAQDSEVVEGPCTDKVECAAASQCAAKRCLFCLCNATVSVSVAGTGVKVGTGAANTWTDTFQYQRECPPCEPVPPPPPSTPTGPTTPGGGTPTGPTTPGGGTPTGPITPSDPHGTPCTSTADCPSDAYGQLTCVKAGTAGSNPPIPCDGTQGCICD